MDAQAIAAFVYAIQTDRTRGASELARAALLSLSRLAEEMPVTSPQVLRTGLAEQVQRLIRARPGMAPIKNLLGAWLDWLSQQPSHDLVIAQKADLALVGANSLLTDGNLSEPPDRALQPSDRLR